MSAGWSRYGEDIRRLDILVNNAGMFLFKPLAETTEEEFDRMFALNTKGRILRSRKWRRSSRKAVAS
jgi:NAD(P)-dependent dehydrogenase (short-subunit alcohol dehydrogenase family)